MSADTVKEMAHKNPEVNTGTEDQDDLKKQTIERNVTLSADKETEDPFEDDLENVMKELTDEEVKDVRIKTLTPKAQEEYVTTVQRYTAKLTKNRKAIQELEESYSRGAGNIYDLKELSERLQNELQTYAQHSEQFIGYLRRKHTEESRREESSHLLIYNSTIQKTQLTLNEISNQIFETASRGERRSIRSVGKTNRSSASSLLRQQKAKMEAAKARLEFADKEAEIIRQQAKLEEQEAKLKAEILLQKSEAKLGLELLRTKKEAAVAMAEYEAVREDLEAEDARSDSLKSKVDHHQRTRKYVLEQQAFIEKERIKNKAPIFTERDIDQVGFNEITPKPEANIPISLNPNARSFAPRNQQTNLAIENSNLQMANELTRFLLRKDLLMSRFSKFNDKPESYQIWKASFSNITAELGVNAREELDLLMKWLGPESVKQAESVRIANARDPEKCLHRLWERLEERYGEPEMIETNIKAKLNKFPTLTNKDHLKLYELIDLLSEIESLKEDPKYSKLLAYFDTSLGVNQIVSKLPYSIQNKWIDRASKYKKNNNTLYPPFTFFVSFIRDLSKQYNDPSFIFKETIPRTQTTHFKSKTSVSTRKTGTSIAQEENETSTWSEKLCPIHKSKHTLNSCRQFRHWSLSERKRFLKDNSICFKCCESTKHMYRDCKTQSKCADCGSDRHATAMHVNYDKNRQQNKNPSSSYGGEETSTSAVSTKCTSICGDGIYGKSCSKVVLVNVYKRDTPEHFVRLYALLDDQSNRTLGQSKLFDALNIHENYQSYTLSSCAGKALRQGRLANGLVVEPVNGRITMSLPTVIECDEIPNAREEIPTPAITKYYEHLKDVPIPAIEPDTEILLLIGRDLIDAHHVYEQRTGPSNAPFAQRLNLGWVVIGEVCLGKIHKPNPTVNVRKTHILNNGRPTTIDPCENSFYVKEHLTDHHCYQDGLGKSLFERTKDDSKIGMSIEDNKFLEIMNKEFVKNENEHWSAPLPFKEDRNRLPNNKPQAFKRAKILQGSLKRDSVKREHFLQFMQEMIDNGHAEKAPPLDPKEEVWYLPIFGVYHHKKKDKIRVVFDASAVFEGTSLNNVLMSGPDLTNNLVGVLLRFRKDPIAVVADIQQMFYQFYVEQCHRNFLRFLWHDDNDITKELIEYRMCVHVFGNTPSPAVATFGLRKCIEGAKPEIQNFVRRNFYVDDGLASFATTDEAISVLKQTQQVLEENGKVRLHKIASNSSLVMKAFDAQDLAKDLKDLNLGDSELPLQHSLGLCWDLNLDCFTYTLSGLDKPITRRGILSTINSLFDPLGFISPVVIQGRVLMREMITETTDWDHPLSEKSEQMWTDWRNSLKPLEDLTIRRCFVPTSFSQSAQKKLHIFSDASEKAIASVAYIRTVSTDGEVNVGFAFGKSKVAPKHGHTIPRLELCAAVLATEIGEMLSDQLDIKSDDIIYYTDSKVVLGYLNNNIRRFQVYVCNRVGKIRKASKPEQWHYVSTDDNPADQGTRHVSASQIHSSSWLLGPSFLNKPDISRELSDQEYHLVDLQVDKELKPEVQSLKTNSNSSNHLGVSRFARFSKWKRLVTAITRLKKYIRQYRGHGSNTSINESITISKSAEQFIIQEVQKDYYEKEIECLRNKRPLSRTSSIISLSPFLDENGLLRVGGRLRNTKLPRQEKTPLIIPGKHHIATLIITHHHEKIHHQGRHFTEGAVRSAGYWITGCKRLVSSLIFKCVKCKRLRGSLCTQKLADLPADRLTPSPPFTFVGVDVFGPWRIVTRRTRGGSAESKRWAVLFTCLNSRAVHIELLEEMSSSSFINALRRFYAIRGKVQEFRSDRGTNFIGSTDALKIDTLNVEDGQLKTFLYNSGTLWKFNAPVSSHMGGVWERLIGVIRRILDGMFLDLKCKNLTHEVLSTFMAEAAAIVNSRPIVPVSTDAEEPLILTPSVLLTQKTGDMAENFEQFDEKDMYKSQWKCVQWLSEMFLETMESRISTNSTKTRKMGTRDYKLEMW